MSCFCVVLIVLKTKLFKETALHLAVKRNQFQAVNVLLDNIREKNRGDLLSLKDELGNTVLHLAAWKRQRQAS